MNLSNDRWADATGARAATVLVAASLALLGGSDALAAGSARSLGMGESSIAIPDPMLLGRDNPAFLGVASHRGLRLSLFDVGAELGNNAFSVGDYTRWNGATLTEADEDEILSRVDGEWSVAGRAIGYGPAFAYGPVAITMRGVGRGGGRIPESVLEVVFDGNTIEEVTDFSAAGGGGWAAAEIGAAYGHSLGGVLAGGETSIGIRASYLYGLYYAGVIHAEGQLVTLPDTLYGSARMDLRTAEGGSGYRVDVGAVHNRGNLNVAGRIEGLLGSMRWTRNVEILRYRAEGANPDLLEDGSSVDDAVATSDTTLAGGAFAIAQPMRVGAGAAYQMGPWLFAGDLEHTARGLYAREDPWRSSVGVERRLLDGHLRPRAGMMLGGTAGPSVTLGMSLLLGPWRLDLDAATFRTLDPLDPKGGRVAMGMGLVLG
jgi:hypothetical protein